MLPGATFSGLGGPLMQQAGQTRIVRAEDVAHMGITEILRHAPRVFAQYRRLVHHIQQTRPAVAVLIDFPDVNFRLAKHCKRLGIPVVWFVSPQLWAWKRRRLRWVKQRVAKMLVIFPFEAAFYRKRHIDATFVGHPLAALPEPSVSRESYAAHHNLDPAKPWVALLPGSRWSEIDRHLPTMVEMACRYPAVGGAQGVEYILPVAATLAFGEARKRLADFVSGWITHYPGTDPGVPLPYIHLVDGAEAAREALYHARTPRSSPAAPPRCRPR